MQVNDQHLHFNCLQALCIHLTILYSKSKIMNSKFLYHTYHHTETHGSPGQMTTSQSNAGRLTRLFPPPSMLRLNARNTCIHSLVAQSSTPTVAAELKAKASQTSDLQYITVSPLLCCSENSPAASETQHLRTKEAMALCSSKGAAHLLDLLGVPLEHHIVQQQRPFRVAPIVQRARCVLSDDSRLMI